MGKGSEFACQTPVSDAEITGFRCLKCVFMGLNMNVYGEHPKKPMVVLVDPSDSGTENTDCRL